MDTTNLIVYLPFDESATQDLCGNEWTAYGTTSIGETNAISGNALQVNKGYIRSNSAITFGGADFTISFYAYVDSASEIWVAPFSAEASLGYDGRVGQIDLRRYQTSNDFSTEIHDSNGSSLGSVSVNNLIGALHHFEYDYSHDDSTFKIFIDGELKATQTCSLERLARYIFLGTNNCRPNNYRMVGSIDEFLLYDGVALHTTNFTPPTDEDYIQFKIRQGLSVPLSFDADVELTLTNATWNPLSNVLVWLPFDESTTQDLCDNDWTVTGEPTIEDNTLKSPANAQNNWLTMTNGIYLGGKNFTICFWFAMNQQTAFCGHIPFSLFDSGKTTAGSIQFVWDIFYNYYEIYLNCLGTETTRLRNPTLGELHFIEIAYDHARSEVYWFFNGELKATIKKKIPRTFFPEIRIGLQKHDSNLSAGTFDEVQIYDRITLHHESFTPPTAEEYAEAKNGFFFNRANTERVLTNNRKPINPYIAFTGNAGCYGEVPLETLAGKSTFTIEAKFSTIVMASSNSWQSKTIFGREIGGSWQDDFGFYVNGGKLGFWAEPKLGGSSEKSDTITEAIVNDGAIHKVAVVAFDGAIDLYCDGEKIAHTDNVNAKISDVQTILLASNSNSYSYMKMNFYEARLWSVARMPEQIFADIQGNEKGLEAWYIPDYRTDIIPDISGHERHVTLYGSPAVSFEYEQIFDYAADVEFLIFNSATGFEYSEEEIGTGLTFLELIDLAMSKTGTAFYQTTLERCFNLPPVPEIWIEFDVYFDDTHRWRAFNGGANGSTGITAQKGGNLSYFSNGNNVGNFSNVCPANQLRTFRLHMKTGAIDGVIEAWVDGQFINKYIGDVNHGELFEDLYLQSDGMDTCFSNFYISNTGFADNKYLMLDFNMERKIKNAASTWSDKADSENYGRRYACTCTRRNCTLF